MLTMTLCLRHGAVQTVIDLPWSLYNTFVLEQRHGFNQTTPKTFVMDLLKTVQNRCWPCLLPAEDFISCCVMPCWCIRAGLVSSVWSTNNGPFEARIPSDFCVSSQWALGLTLGPPIIAGALHPANNPEHLISRNMRAHCACLTACDAQVPCTSFEGADLSLRCISGAHCWPCRWS